MKGTNAQNKASLMRWRQKKTKTILMNLLESILKHPIKRVATIPMKKYHDIS